MGIFDFIRLAGRTVAALDALDGKVGTVLANQKRIFIELRSIMADLNKVQEDQAATRASLTEIRADLNSVRTVSEQFKTTITAHEALIAELRQQLIDAGGNPELLDSIAAGAAELNRESREIADIVSPEAPPATPTA